MTTSDAIDEITKAMVKAQAAIEPAVKGATNPAFKSKYADLAAIWTACRKPLNDNGVAIFQDVTNASGGVAVSTRLTHVSGQWIEFGPLVVPLARVDAHSVGSATTYGKRYTLCAAVGIVAEEDDDGNAAVGNGGRRYDLRDEPDERQPIQRTQPQPAPRQPLAAVPREREPGDDDEPFQQTPRTNGNGGGRVITEPQRRRLYAKAMAAGHDRDSYRDMVSGITGNFDDRVATTDKYDELIAAAERGR